MRKFVFIMGLLLTIPTYATTMCAENDTVAVVLDPSLGISNYSSNTTTGTWRAWNTQGTIYGISACLNSNHGQSRGGTVARLKDTNNGETKLVSGSEKYGKYCWCRSTHPISSLWTYNLSFGSVLACATDCANRCNFFLQSEISLRVGLIGSIEN